MVIADYIWEREGWPNFWDMPGGSSYLLRLKKEVIRLSAALAERESGDSPEPVELTV